jgi:hypothetical protein
MDHSELMTEWWSVAPTGVLSNPDEYFLFGDNRENLLEVVLPIYAGLAAAILSAFAYRAPSATADSPAPLKRRTSKDL